MADSDSTNAPTRTLSDITGEMETLQNTLKILNDLANEHVCDWSGNDDKETVGRMVERVIVLTNAMGEKLDTLEEFIREIYKIQFSHKAVEVAHV